MKRLICLATGLVFGVCGLRDGASNDRTLERTVAKQECRAIESRRTIRLLITRHGFSCANYAGKFHKSWSIGKATQVSITDPLLTHGGSIVSMQQGAAVERWLKKNDIPGIDAVLSSSLARAQETAALQFPGKPVIPVPYLSETGMGYDNTARDLDWQVKAVSEAVKEVRPSNDTLYQVNMHFLKAIGDGGAGDWQQFRKFLAEIFLPWLEDRLPPTKPLGSPITLAVVTHSNFMKEGELKQKCSSNYQDGAKNNQVVELSYVFRTLERTAECSPDITPEYSLEDTDKRCGRVNTGLRIRTLVSKAKIPLCKRDIGEQCYQAMGRETGFEETLEQLLEAGRARQLQLRAFIKEESLKASEVDNEDAPAKYWAWSSRQDKVETAMKVVRKAYKDLEAQNQYMADLSTKVCLDGGPPDVSSAE
mmetsp:Transcript_110889/g.236853  ORF Transcript_110889/g.236853 Transcript_110889/m.236853 type:complete len:421 (+) Transcript_110889:59-1321(+)